MVVQNASITISDASSCEKNALGYARVSTGKQKERGASIDSQVISINEYAKNNNLHIIDIVKEAKSASKLKPDKNSIMLTDRPGLKDIIRRAQNREFSDLIIYSRDRFTRSFSEFIALKATFYKLNITIHFSNASERISPEDKALDKFFELMISNMSMLEANIIGQRSKLGLKANILNGYYPGGHVAYGYELKNHSLKHKKYYIKNSQEELIIQEIFKLYNFGYSFDDISKELKNKYPNEKKIKFQKSTIAQIINNKMYTGLLVWNRKSGNQLGLNDGIIESVPICDTKIIEPKSFEEVHKIKNNKVGGNAKNYTTPFLLKGIIICGNCNNPLKTKNNGRGKSNVYYCKCLNNNNKWSLSIPQNLIESFVIEILTSAFNNIKDKNLFSKYYDEYLNFYNKQKQNFESNKYAIESRLKKIKEYILKSEETFKNKLSLQQSNQELYNTDFFNILQITLTKLKIEEETLKKQLEDAEDKLRIKELSYGIFEGYFNNIISDFFRYPFQSSENISKPQQRLSRILIEKVVEKVIVNYTPYGENLSIFIKVPQSQISYSIKLQDTCPINNIQNI